VIQQGKFITVEGIEGVGKSTNLRYIQNFLTEKGIDLVATREPGGTPVAEAVRELLLDVRHTDMVSDTELLLMFAARAQHIQELIKPALAQGQWVVSDRFTDATYAYQGGGRGVSIERISELEQWVQGDLRPDMTLILDADPKIGLARVASRGEDTDRFEQEKVDFFHKVRSVYLRQAGLAPERYAIIDASQSLAAVQAQLSDTLQVFLSRK